VSEEAAESCAVEGEILDRYRVQAALRRNFGIDLGQKSIPPFEEGMAYDG